MMRNSLKLKLFQNVFIVLVFLSCLSCKSSKNDPGLLSVLLAAEPNSLDPTLAEGGSSLMILNHIMEGLLWPSMYFFAEILCMDEKRVRIIELSF